MTMAARALSKTQSAQAVEKQLARYRAMRDFETTPEPRGSGRAQGKTHLPFVVQKHAATRLHYDFRLGWRGVLKSWAIAKGPSYFPGDRRLAVQVEDHPMEYGGFEGIIPKGQYGGGTVMVWDRGEWTPLGDVDRGLADGHLKFELHGEKLKGRWALVRMDDGRYGNDRKPSWLLIKDRDDFARGKSDPAITDESPDSVVTRRSMEQIAENADTVWNSKPATRNAAATHSAKNRQPARDGGGAKKGEAKKEGGTIAAAGPRERFPGFIAPELAQLSTEAPGGSGWAHELKLDGYRIQAQIRTQNRSPTGSRRKAALLTRKGLDWTRRMPAIAEAASLLSVEDAILDGEVVALNDKGIASFAELQAAFHEGHERFLVYYAFDLLHLNGHNTRGLSLLERKELLAQLLAGDTQSGKKENAPIRLSEHFLEDGAKVFAHACRLGAEGIVSKRTAAPYTSGRGDAWLKIKCVQEQELVIGGFTLPSKGGAGIGALLLGYYEGRKLRYAGRSGTGFTEATRRALRKRLDALTRKQPSFDALPAVASRGVRWVKPELVAQIAFATWTRDGLVRQASFKGLREDKPAREVVKETPPAAVRPRGKKAARRKRGGRGVGSGLRRESSDEEGGNAMPVQSPITRQFSITHPDKVLDRDSGMTKQVLAAYYFTVAERMLPHVADRPLSVVRCPEGSEKPCFFQKHVGFGLAQGVGSIAVPNLKTGKKADYLTVDSAEGLVGLAQMGVLEVHTWGSRNQALDRPDRIVFDLDPDAAVPFSTLAETARDLRRRLGKLKLESFLKSTGGKGLHVVVPVEPKYPWETIKGFAHGLVLEMEAEHPELYITRASKAERSKRIFLDYLRNDREATSIAPFSPRARKGVPVAMTLGWNELKDDQRPVFHVTDLADWRSRLKRDPWKEMETLKQRLNTEAQAEAQRATQRTPRRR
jgi:bifunctional non-homologous end joining protein LigD